MEIKIYNTQRKFKINESYFKKIAKIIMKKKLAKKFDLPYDLYIEFTSKEKIIKINKKLFNRTYLTDVISMPLTLIDSNLDPKLRNIYGEIFICPFTANKQCSEYNNTFKQELTLLVIHGLLHLLGYKDYTAAQKQIMQQEERKIIKEYLT